MGGENRFLNKPIEVNCSVLGKNSGSNIGYYHQKGLIKGMGYA
jgi:hypothetical protein